MLKQTQGYAGAPVLWIVSSSLIILFCKQMLRSASQGLMHEDGKGKVFYINIYTSISKNAIYIGKVSNFSLLPTL